MALYIGNQKVAPTIEVKVGERYGTTGSSFLGTVDANGKLQEPTEDIILNFTGVVTIDKVGLSLFRYGDYVQGGFKKNIKSILFPNLTTVNSSNLTSEQAMNGAFRGCTGLTSVDLSSLTTVSGGYAMQYAFYGCTGLTGELDLSNLTTVSGTSAMYSAFQGCTGLTSVDLSSLTTVSGNSAMYQAFQSCTGLTSVDLSSLTTINDMSKIFKGCTSLISVDLSSVTSVYSYSLISSFEGCTSLASFSFPSLSTLNAYQAIKEAFINCTSLTTLSFPSLASVGSNHTNQFNNMLSGVTGCTVHFPSNLQSVIGSWSDVTAGFGGTNTTVLFDLPATT